MGDDLTKEIEVFLANCLSKMASSVCYLAEQEALDVLLRQHLAVLHKKELAKQEELQALSQNLEDKCGKDIRVCFYQIFVGRMYLENVDKIGDQRFPRKVGQFVQEDFLRAIKIAREGKARSLTPNNYIFFSYLEVLTFQRFPLGNHSAVIAGFPRSIVAKQSPFEMLRFFLLLCLCKGNEPFYELHYNPHRMRLFSPEGWQNVLANGAKLLVINPDVKGIFGATWLFDPALKGISPELSYLREQIIHAGGSFFFNGRRKNDRQNAFAMSKVRRNAFEEGRYDPTSYLAIIPRKALLKHFKM